MGKITCATEVFVATALLHQELPDREDFSISEIVTRAEMERLTPRLRPGVRVHATSHCVAGLPPSPARYCTLHATTSGRRRLFKPGDPIHSARQGAKITPRADEVPETHRHLLVWYENEYLASKKSESPLQRTDPLLELRGSGRELWRDESPDEYIERLRRDW